MFLRACGFGAALTLGLAGCGGQGQTAPAARNVAAAPVVTVPAAPVPAAPVDAAAADAGDLVSSADPPATIAGTDVPDTPGNRRVVAFCERYREALEARDDKALLALASRNYHDHGVDRATLQQSLTQMMSRTDSIRYDIRYRAVRHYENGRVLVEMSYTATYIIQGRARNVAADNQLVLEPEGESFRILSGM